MKILVDRLSETPTALRFEGDPDWWGEVEVGRGEPEGPEVRLCGPVVFELRAHTMGEDIFLEGAVSGPVELGCGRCLARYRQELRESFRIVLEPAGDRVPAEPEGSAALLGEGLCLGDELEAGWYRGREIDLTRYFREVVALGLPIQPICGEDCRGLCPRCGVDRNVESCRCPQSSTQSPFAVLRALRTDQGEN